MNAEQPGSRDEETVLRAVVLISKRKRYQVALILFLGAVFHMMNIALLSPAVVFDNPSFVCEGYAEPVGEDEACAILAFCRPKNEQTLTAQLSIFCEGRKDDRNLIQSVSGVGGLFGVLMVNWLADRKGKRFCIFLALLLASTSAYVQLLGILRDSLEMIIASQFLIGYAYGAFTTLVFFLGTRYLSDMSQYVVLIFYLCGTGTAQLSIAAINELFPGWHAYLAIYTVGFTAALLLAPFVVQEDPVYLYNNSQMDELMVLVESTGSTNRATVQQMQAAQNELSRIDKHRGKRTPQMAQLFPQELRSAAVVMLIGVMFCCSFTNNSVYYGIGFSIDKFGLSVTHTMLIFGGVEIVNYLSSMAAMAFLPGIRTLLYGSALTATLLCFSFLTEAVQNSQLLQMAAIAGVRFLITTYGSFYISYYISNLPKKIEGTASGIIESLGTLGKVAAPYVVRIAAEKGVNSMVLFGSIFFVVGFLPLHLLPAPKLQPPPPLQRDQQVINYPNSAK